MKHRQPRVHPAEIYIIYIQENMCTCAFEVDLHWKSELEWLESLTWITCPSPLWFRIPLGTWILLCEEAIQLAYGTSVIRVWNNARSGNWGLPLPEKLESRHITFTVLVRRITQGYSIDPNRHKYIDILMKNKEIIPSEICMKLS